MARGARSAGYCKASAIRYRNGQLFFAGTPRSLRDSYGLSKYELGAGNISEDARGRWYLDVTIKVKKTPKPATGKSSSPSALISAPRFSRRRATLGS